MEKILKPIAEVLTRKTAEKPAELKPSPVGGRAAQTAAKSLSPRTESAKPVSQLSTNKSSAAGESKKKSAKVEGKSEPVTKQYPSIAIAADQDDLVNRATTKPAATQPSSAIPKDQPKRQKTSNGSGTTAAQEFGSSVITTEQWGELDNFIRRTKKLKPLPDDEE